MTISRNALLATLLGSILLAASPGRADDKYAGYYYPPPQDTETYAAPVKPLRSPDLGQHSEEILREIGVSPRDLQELKDKNIVR